MVNTVQPGQVRQLTKDRTFFMVGEIRYPSKLGREGDDLFEVFFDRVLPGVKVSVASIEQMSRPFWLQFNDRLVHTLYQKTCGPYRINYIEVLEKLRVAAKCTMKEVFPDEDSEPLDDVQFRHLRHEDYLEADVDA